MFSLSGVDQHIENVYRLAEPFATGELETLSDLRTPFLTFLNSKQPEFMVDTSAPLIVTELERSKQFSTAFSASKIDDLSQERMVGSDDSSEPLNEKIELLQESLELLSKSNPQLAELFHVTVHSILLCGSNTNSEGFKAHGGTTNRCIGLIWLNINPQVSKHNLVEMLIHEFIHTLVFIDELNFGHFNYSTITKQKYWATSSILKRERPMDKVVHSILVSHEILSARMTYFPLQNEKYLFHPRCEALKSSTLSSIDSVLNHPHLQEVCEPRSITLIEQAKVELLKLRIRN